MSDYYLRVGNQLEVFQGCCSSWTGLFTFLGMPGSWLRRQPGSLFHVFLISLWTSRLAQACPSHAGGWSAMYRPPKCKPISCFCFCHSHWHPSGQSKVYKWAQSQVVRHGKSPTPLPWWEGPAKLHGQGHDTEKEVKNWGHCCYLPRTVCQNTMSFLERWSKAFTSFSLWPKSSKFQEPPIHTHPWVQGLYLLYSYIFKA